MNRIKKYFICALLLCSALSYSQYTDQINSNRPGKSMSAYAVGKTIIQAEAGIFGIMEDHEVLDYETRGIGLDLALRYGEFLEELEFILEMQYQFDQYSDALNTYNRNNFRQINIGAKYLIYNPDKYYTPEENLYSWKAKNKFKFRKLIPSVAVYAGANIPGKDNPYTFTTDKLSPKVMAITQNYWGKWVWINNIIADKIGTDYPSYGIISTLTRGFNANWSGFAEFQGYKSDYYGDGVARVGAARLIGDNMQIDASISGNFKNTPSILYGGVGFSWRFDANYSDILLPGEGDREEEYKQQQEKEKEEKKKRKKERAERRKQRNAEPDAPAPEEK